VTGGRVIRLVRASALATLERFLRSRLAIDGQAAGRIINAVALPREEFETFSEQVNDDDSDPFVAAYEHPRLPFPTYPHEWAAGMLSSAAELTLDLAREALGEGWGLKDATPYNIAFCGPRPVFIDVLSFEQRDPTNATWLPYAQFVRTFLLPLLAARSLGLSTRITFSRGREGIEPEEMYKLLPLRRKVRGAGLSLVTLPALLGSRAVRRAPRVRPSSPERATFVLEHLFRHLRSALSDVRLDDPKSHWSSYTSGEVHGLEYHEFKGKILEQILTELRPLTVLDLGCNVGHFSVVAAKCGASVVAVDSDVAAVEMTFRRASAEALDILPLVVDLADPTPARGWRNEECSSFLARATGSFDVVLALAFVHHLRVSAGVPMPAILALLADLSTNVVVVELIPPDDPMFKLLSRGRDQLYGDATRESFLAACHTIFDIVRSERIAGSGRELFVLRKRSR